MKYKADYNKKLKFNMMQYSGFDKFIGLSKDEEKTEFFYKDILQFDKESNLIIDGKDMSHSKEYCELDYNTLVRLEYYPVHEVKEEPIKPSIEPNRDIPKGKNVDVVSKLFLQGEDVTEAFRQVCREEIAKSEKKQHERYASYIKKSSLISHPKLNTNIEDLISSIDKKAAEKWRNGAWDAVSGMLDARKNKDKYLTKKPKQEFDGKKKVWINDILTRIIQSDNAMSEPDNYHLASQAEINSFFKGTKSRDRNYTWRKITSGGICTFYKYLQKDNLIQITEKEYLEGINNKS